MAPVEGFFVRGSCGLRLAVVRGTVAVRLAAAAQLRCSYAAIALGSTVVVTLTIRYIDLLRVRTEGLGVAIELGLVVN